MEKIFKCPICGLGNLHYHEITEIFAYKGLSITLTQPGQWCDHCDKCIVSRDNVLSTEAKLKAWKEEVLDRTESRAMSTATFKRKVSPMSTGVTLKYWDLADLKLEEIADRLQESVEYLSAVLKGNAHLSAELAAKIEREFGISADVLMRVEQRYIQ